MEDHIDCYNSYLLVQFNYTGRTAIILLGQRRILQPEGD